MSVRNPIAKLPSLLLPWFAENARVLPWRDNTDPYRVWVSEIMLQQTRVDTVIDYYKRFLKELPTIESLARCPEERLLKLWEGLGYYSRVRNMRKAACEIQERHNGIFPNSWREIRALSGIGDYTAGAIASIAFGLKEPAVDGNVLRVMARYTGSESDISFIGTKRDFSEQLRAIYPEGQCGNFTQSLMELGATVCLPHGEPQCLLCPLRNDCIACRENKTSIIPVKQAPMTRKIEKHTVLILAAGDKVAIRQRPAKGLLARLWEFPFLNGEASEKDIRDYVQSCRCKVCSIKKLKRAKHLFTHLEWQMTGYFVRVEAEFGDFCWITPNAMREERALPSALKYYGDQLDSLFDDHADS